VYVGVKVLAPAVMLPVPFSLQETLDVLLLDAPFAKVYGEEPHVIILLPASTEGCTVTLMVTVLLDAEGDVTH
jgi:hypothetical protein